MAELIRWEPTGMRTLRSTIDSLFDEFFRLPQTAIPQLRAPIAGAQIPIDVIEGEKEFLIKANVPGIKKEDLEVEISSDSILIKGKYEEQKEDESRGYRVRERYSGSFSRLIPVGQNMLLDKTEARYENGVLELIVPKREAEKPSTRRLEIQG